MSSASDDADTDEESREEGFEGFEGEALVDPLDDATAEANPAFVDAADSALRGWRAFEAELADYLSEEARAERVPPAACSPRSGAPPQAAATLGQPAGADAQATGDDAQLNRAARALAHLLGARASGDTRPRSRVRRRSGAGH